MIYGTCSYLDLMKIHQTPFEMYCVMLASNLLLCIKLYIASIIISIFYKVVFFFVSGKNCINMYVLSHAVGDVVPVCQHDQYSSMSLSIPDDTCNFCMLSSVEYNSIRTMIL